MEGTTEAGQGPRLPDLQQPPAAVESSVAGQPQAARTWYAAGTVPHKAQPAFAEVATETLRRDISTTSAQEHGRARDDMLQLPSLVLWGKQASQRRHYHVLSHTVVNVKVRKPSCPDG